MTAETSSSSAPDPEVEAFAQGLIETSARLRLPELFTTEHPNAIYWLPERNGVSVVALRTTDLGEATLIKLLRYRLAQYLAVSFVDARMIYEQRIEYEPLENVYPDDVHFIAGSVDTGELLCYAAMKAPPAAPPGTTLRERARPVFPVEQVHGWGIFNRLRVLPDLPIAKLRELGRFVKNQQLHTLHEQGLRGPVEVGVALFRALAGPLRLEIEAVIGDLEEGVARQNLEYFHVPLVVLHGTVPYEAEASYFFPRYQFCTVYPFAALTADISGVMMERLNAIEAALEQPGKEGLLALFALKRQAGSSAKSSLEPPEGLAPLIDTPVPQEGVVMQERRRMLDRADRLRATGLLGGLSVAEATVLGTYMDRTEAPAGEVIVQQGDEGDDLYLIESGEVEVRISGRGDEPIVLNTLGPGDYFGEIALLTGEVRIADVVAVTPVTLLRLSRDAFGRYLSHAAEVEQQIARTAVSRTRETARRMRTGE